MMIIGSAQVVHILISIIKIKVLAVLLGPSGVGLLSIYQSLQDMVQQTAGLGMGSSGVRQIASSRGEEATLSRVRRVLFAAHLLQGGLAMLAVWLLRAPIATWLFGDATRATEVGLIGAAILLALLGTAQTALLQGLRRIADLGRVTVLAAFTGTVAGLAAVWLQGEGGLIWFILVQPLATVLVALHFTRRLPRPTAARLSVTEIWEIWKPMAMLGAAFMLAALATAITLLFVRSSIAQNLGIDTAGQFAAAWGLTFTYMGFLIGAMAADFYPRLTSIILKKETTNSLVNDQTQLGLAIGGPLILLMIGLAPWVMILLYSPQFLDAASMMQIQMVGNVIKLAGFPLGYMFVAAARSKLFLFTQINWNVFFLVALWWLVPLYGLAGAGFAFCLAYIFNFLIANFLVRSLHAFRWEHLTMFLFALHVILSVGLLALARTAPQAAAIASICLALATGLFGLRVVLIKMGPEGRVASRFARIYAAIGWPIRSIP